MKKVAILGTSNTLANWGYTGILKGDGRREYKAYGLGASSGLMACLFLDEILADAPNVCIIEIAVNDSVVLHLGETSRDNITQNYDFLISALLSSGILPLILVLPHRSFVTRRNVVRQISLDRAERAGAPAIDGYELISRRLAAGEDEAALFRDPAHIGEASCRDVAAAIIETLDAWDGRRLPEAGRPARRYGYIPVGEAMLEKGRTIFAETALYSATVALIQDESRLRFRLKDDERIVGIGVDLLRSNGRLAIGGRAPSSKELCNRYHKPQASGLLACVLPLRTPAAPEDGVVELALGGYGDVSADVNSHYLEPPAERRGETVALTGVVVEARNFAEP